VNSAFVLPAFLEKKQELIMTLQKTAPANVSALEQNIGMRLLDLAGLPSDFLVHYWYIFLPVLGVIPVFFRRQLEASAVLRFFLVGLITSLSLALLFFHSVAIGLGGAILLSYWKI
jgi:hypothetical protein